MANTGLEGPFELTTAVIDRVIKLIRPGAYALGRIRNDGVFIVEYVGRSDNDLNQRLKNWVGDYSHFKASYFNSAIEAFKRECNMFHDFGEDRVLDNDIHPDCPDGYSAVCSVCKY